MLPDAVPAPLDDLAGAMDTPLGLRCLACGWYFTDGRCRRCTTLGAPIGVSTDPGSPDPGERADGAASPSGEALSADFADTSPPPMPPADALEPCPACGWFRELGTPCVRCTRLGPPEPSTVPPGDGLGATIGAQAGSTAPGLPAPSSGECIEPGESETAVETAASGPDLSPQDDGERPQEVQVRTIPQPHGGALLPGGRLGNRGGGRPPAATKAQLRAALREVGAPLLRRAMERAEVDFRPVVVGSKDDRRVEMVAIPIDTRVAILAAQVAAELTESKMAPEKPEATRPRLVRVVVKMELAS